MRFQYTEYKDYRKNSLRVPVKAKLLESPAGILAFVCVGLLSRSPMTTSSWIRRAAALLSPALTFSTTLPSHSHARTRNFDIIIHPPSQHFDAFRDGGFVVNQIPTSCSIQSQDCAHISRPILQVDTWKYFQCIFLLEDYRGHLLVFVVGQLKTSRALN